MIDDSPNYLPDTLDISQLKVKFLNICEDTYNNSSFLDDRYLSKYGPGVWLPWDQVAAAAATLNTSSDFIFHIGHTGSTLLSRLLSVTGEVLPLREPSVLHALGRLQSIRDLGGQSLPGQAFSEWLSVILRLLGRTYRPGQRTLIKPTSVLNVMAPAMLDQSPRSKAILLFIKPQSYLATILSSQSSRKEARTKAALRLGNIHRRLGGEHWRLDEMREGEIIAMAWVGAIMALADAAALHPDRVLWVDFEYFLRQPRDALWTIIRHLREPGSEGGLDEMVGSPLLRKYSKDPSRPYDVGDRGRAIAWANQNSAADIADGRAWIDAFERLQPAWGAWTSMVAAR